MVKDMFFCLLRYVFVVIFTVLCVTITGFYGTRFIAIAFASTSGLTADATLPAVITYWLLPVLFFNGLLFIATFYMIRGMNRLTRRLLDRYENRKPKEIVREETQRKSKKKK